MSESKFKRLKESYLEELEAFKLQKTFQTVRQSEVQTFVNFTKYGQLLLHNRLSS